MSWFKRLLPSKIRTETAQKKGVPEGVWVKCEGCNDVLYRAELEKNAEVAFAKAQERATKLNDITLEIAAQSSDEGKLYGSVSINEILESLKARGFDVSKREIQMPNGPIYSIGDYVVDVILHSDVVANLKVTVVSAK